jgi:DNA-binding NtrC family response regulator
MASVLLVDDLPDVRAATALLLARDGHVAHEAPNLARALEVLAATEVDVIVSGVRLDTHGDRTAILHTIRSYGLDIPVIIVTACGTVDEAVDAMKAGAHDYLARPFDPSRLLLAVRAAAEHGRVGREGGRLRTQAGADGRIVAVSRAMRAVIETIGRLARTDSTVLITGESGTGKELVARALYAQSSRRTGKFVPINCGAIPDTMLESELFGHRKGAFTSSIVDKKGLLEEANHGVLFLDEIGEMPPSMQVGLLRFAEGGEMRRIGETDTRRVDARLVLATHRSLEDEIARGRFREDFYYRINVAGIHLPALRDRREDILPLANYLLPRLAARLHRTSGGFTPDAADALTAYAWPGNVRELHNAIERALNVASGELISSADLPARVTAGRAGGVALDVKAHAADRERLLDALTQHHWNQKDTAASLGMSRTTLWRRLRELRIES